jgi:putative redox protein
MHTMEVRHERGDRLAIGIRGHEVIADQPLEDGGADTGPTPTELWVAGLAACVVFYAERFFRRHDLPMEDLRATCRWSFAEDRPARVGRIEVHLDLPADFPEALRPRLQAVIDHCTVHGSIRTPPVVEISTHVPAAA